MVLLNSISILPENFFSYFLGHLKLWIGFGRGLKTSLSIIQIPFLLLLYCSILLFLHFLRVVVVKSDFKEKPKSSLDMDQGCVNIVSILEIMVVKSSYYHCDIFWSYSHLNTKAQRLPVLIWITIFVLLLSDSENVKFFMVQ